ncbi:MAG: amidohydrolase [Novosphingobium sp.]|uniref:amidohydrolase n=1 Tax=Novosphingobium sp. TaxID=1874826 RepID=UPI0032B91FAA
MVRGLKLALAALGLAMLGNSAQAIMARPITSLWHHGTIITMDGPRAKIVPAVVVRSGKIVFTGPLAQARKVAGRGFEDHDLKGATMLPGFVDAHSHFSMLMRVATGIDLDAGEGAPRSIADLLAKVGRGIEARMIAQDDWVVAWNYKDAALAEKRHVTRADLDKAFPGRKVLLMHFTGHGLVASSAAMAAAGVKDDTPNPEGGLFLRDGNGKPNGVVFEAALTPFFAVFPKPTYPQMIEALNITQRQYAANGYTHAQDGATQLADLDFLRSDGAKLALTIDLALLPSFAGLDNLLARGDLAVGQYQGRTKVQGIKFVLDGSPQARTAFFTKNYANGSPEGHHPWHGEPIVSQEVFNAAARKVHARGWQIFAHANGDAAIDMAIKAFDALGIKAGDNRRPVVIHSQFQRPEQLKDYARIGVGPAYFSNHTYYFADVHRSNFSTEVVGFISPFKAAIAAGLHPSNHSDAPVTTLDPFIQLWSSMARTSLSGVVNGPSQRLTAYEGLQMLTTGPAWQVFEEDRKGRIKVGLLADFVVLDRNPLRTPLDQIRSIRVMQTIKEGRVIWTQH